MNPEVLSHFANPHNVGELPPPAIRAEVTNPACGDVLRLTARLEQGRVAEARFLTRGCVASIAASSVLTDLMKGCTLEELRLIDKSAVESALGGLPPASIHAAALCMDALKEFLRRCA